MKSCAPGVLWRMTTRSTCSASMLRTVSSSVSPFLRLLTCACIFTMSAERRCSASSNETRVRVLGSTKKLTTVLPRRAGTFLTLRSETFLNSSAVSRRKVISSGLRSYRLSRSFLVHSIRRLLVLNCFVTSTRLHKCRSPPNRHRRNGPQPCGPPGDCRRIRHSRRGSGTPGCPGRPAPRAG